MAKLLLCLRYILPVFIVMKQLAWENFNIVTESTKILVEISNTQFFNGDSYPIHVEKHRHDFQNPNKSTFAAVCMCGILGILITYAYYNATCVKLCES